VLSGKWQHQHRVLYLCDILPNNSTLKVKQQEQEQKQRLGWNKVEN
jgi:hypothetical protein